MERLGIYIFVFFFFGVTFFERVRTRGETGSLWKVLFRNFRVLVFAVLGFFLAGFDMMYNGSLFEAAKALIWYQPPYGEIVPGARWLFFIDTWRQCLFCAASTLIVSAGIWELQCSASTKSIFVVVFSLVIYPLFGNFHWGGGFLDQAGFYDYNGALIIWALPAAFVLGARLLVPSNVLPAERVHHLKGFKVLPGMKHRFFLSRGIGFTMVFLVLNATTLVDEKWFVSKTLTLIPASFTILFSQLLFYSLFGRNNIERTSYGPPVFAVMAALVATQSCNEYDREQALIVSVITTFVILIFLRIAPQKIRIWDPICSLPIFLLGGILGALMASITGAAQVKSQLLGVGTCLVFGMGAGLVLTAILRLFKRMEKKEFLESLETAPQSGDGEN